MNIYLSVSFEYVGYVVIDVSLLLVVHVYQPESTASCVSTNVLPDWVVTTDGS